MRMDGSSVLGAILTLAIILDGGLLAIMTLPMSLMH